MKEKEFEMLVGYLRRILPDTNIQDTDIQDTSIQNINMQDAKNQDSDSEMLGAQLQEAGRKLQSLQLAVEEISDSFNKMIMQLQERENSLKEQAERERNRAEMIASYNELLVMLSNKRDEWIMVVDAEEKKIVYCNKQEFLMDNHESRCRRCRVMLPFMDRLMNWDGDAAEERWEIAGDGNRFFRIITFRIEWRGRRALSHIVNDITKERSAEKKLATKAYHDAATGIYNRRYFLEQMNEILKERRNFSLCYIDLDDLKSVNDQFGHNEGDSYIQQFVETLRWRFRSTDIFARVGGDEFCVVMPECSPAIAEAKLISAQEKLAQENGKAYVCSFSFGVISVSGLENLVDMLTYCGFSSVGRQTGNGGFRALAGQQSGVFRPSGIFSVLNTSKEQERAMDFVRYMISEEGQKNNQGSGFPVNRKAFDAVLSEDFLTDSGQSGYTVGASNGETGESVSLTYEWPTQEELTALREIVESLSVCANSEEVMKQVVLEETQRCLNGEISEEEAVNSIMQKINLYLAES